MLQVDERFEITIPAFGPEDAHMRRFHWAELCMDAPLWYIGVLPSKAIDGMQLWSRYLATRAADAAAILANQPWEATRLHVLLPGYMTEQGELEFARCSALWQCRALPGHDQTLWLFESDQGTHVEPTNGIDVANVVRSRLHWQDVRAQETRRRSG